MRRLRHDVARDSIEGDIIIIPATEWWATKLPPSAPEVARALWARWLAGQ
ncbi:MAG: hypothetical protein HZA88_19180 [Verrucomicrobia bacterium]|nr:hypothetical protein [Verrucomicrobiota bacterium]